LNEKNLVAEGINTTFFAYEISKRSKIDMPIVATVKKILNQGVNIKEAIKKLIERPLKTEF
jgi:glycerol-3-phosphate dehydrogenase